MKFTKRHLDDIERCYCTSHMEIDDNAYAFFASENPKSQCHSYSGPNFSKKETVWEGERGGCMSIVPFETRKGEFLAINEFYLKVSPSHAKMVHGRKTENGWEVQDLFNLPYLHRFDIYHVNNKDYIICATIARDKSNKEDWTRPGQIYVGQIPDSLEKNVVLRQIVDNCYRNHGYSRGKHNSRICGYFGSDQGVIRITPPYSETEDWLVEKVLYGNVSEVALADIDNDGNDEMMTIEPFHGNRINLYHVDEDGKYKLVYVYPNDIDFAHALIAANLCNKPCFVAGIRRINCEIFVLRYENGNYIYEIVDEGAGPANLDVVHCKGMEYILAANHTRNEAAIYEVQK